jgi:hypothetical protein
MGRLSQRYGFSDLVLHTNGLTQTIGNDNEPVPGVDAYAEPVKVQDLKPSDLRLRGGPLRLPSTKT